MNEFNFACDKCPRTFKLEEFYEKHKKVHELKKQHRCGICGFVYGAAKGLEGHLKTHTEPKVVGADLLAKTAEVAAAAAAAKRADPVADPPANPNFYFSSRGVLAEAKAPNATQNSVSDVLDSKASTQAGTGVYEVYDYIPPEVENGAQNETGFFVCKICRREFSGLNSLRKHVPIHTRRVQHKCDTCGHVFGKKEYLVDHMRKHTGEVSPVCEVCSQSFSKTLKLKEHFKLHRNMSEDGVSDPTHPFKCHICQAVFKFTSILGKHISVGHPESFVKCELCNAAFGDVRAKNQHVQAEHRTTPDSFAQKKVWCPVCNQGFTRQYNLKIHMHKAHGKDYVENNFSAEDMITLTRSPSSVTPSAAAATPKTPETVAHHYFDAKQGTQMLSCQMCSRKFVRKNDLHIHMDADHGVLLFACSLCDDKFLDVMSLQSHASSAHRCLTAKRRKPGPASKTNAPLENRAFAAPSNPSCEICLKVVENGAALREHVLTVHVKGFKFPCELCGKAFQFGGELETHQRVKHPNLSKRAAQMRDALGLVEDCGPAAKRACLTNSSFDDRQDKHVKETDEMRPMLLAAKAEAARAVREAKEAESNENPVVEQPESVAAPPPPPPNHQAESEQRQHESQQNGAVDEDDVRYEAITEDFMFEDQIVHPCYVVLPFVTDVEVTVACNPKRSQNNNEYAFNDDDDEGGRLTIDETVREEEEEAMNVGPPAVKLDDPEITKKQKEGFLNPPLSVLGLEPVPPSDLSNYNAEDIRLPNPDNGFYPKISDYSLPFSLSNLWKKKADILGPKAMHELEMLERVEQMKKYNGTLVGGPDAIDRLNASPPRSKSPSPRSANKKRPQPEHSPDPYSSSVNGKDEKKKTPRKESPNDSGVVQDYENNIQSDTCWPLQCIKCVVTVDNLDAFNIHMNDHWSEDKCCPVCGLLINSKRFNFKQHLKIHTGEKPFVCKICSRSFRQKAHMVKHISIHRTVPDDLKRELIKSE